MNQPMPISASVEVAASPEQVWEVVSDVTRMPEWSPELRRLYVLGSRKSGVGTLMLGINRRGLAVWPTTSKVVRFEPGKAVAWRTRESGATWTYEIEPAVEGTRITGRRDLAKFSPGSAALLPLIGGAAGHDAELAAGIATTLERIKATIEAAQQRRVGAS
jgi:uncharacterized protein YndB with AHSA1/START domain